MKISVSNRAKSNIFNITTFTLNISINYANRVVNEIYSTIFSIKEALYIGRYVPELSGKYYRERICGNYRIIYIVSEKRNTVFVRYIISGKQNSNFFFEVHKYEILNFINHFID